MKTLLLLVWMATAAIAYPGDVFRYNDELTKQSHFMEGEPGSRVSGGWAFESPEGNQYMLNYKADDLGFQPEANYIPVQVEDTEEVASAKADFYSAFNEEKARVQTEVEEEVPAEEVVADLRRRREEEAEPVTEADVMPEENAVEENAKLKQAGSYFYLNQANPLVGKNKLVFHPYYGYIPVDAKENAEKKLYTYHPYNGYIPVAMKDGKPVETEGPKFQFNPYYGFVPVAAEPKVDAMMAEKKVDQMVYHPYYGFISIEKLKEQEELQKSQKFAYDPFYGYVPVKMTKTETPEEPSAVEMTEEKSEEKYLFNPFYGFMQESKLMDDKMKAGFDMTKKYVLHPYLGFVPESMANQKMTYDPLTGLQVPMVKDDGDVKPVEEEQEEGKVEEAPKEEKGLFVFHPIYGFIPKSKMIDQKMAQGVNVNKKFVLNPYYGFIPQPEPSVAPANQVAEKMNAMTEEMPNERKKRSPQYIYPSYQYPALPLMLYSNPDQPIAKSDFTIPASTNLLTPATPYKFELPPTVIQSEVPKPIYYIPQTIPVQKLEAEEKPEGEAEKEIEDPVDPVPDTASNFPSVPLGATVAQPALPEKDFPIFPYDPDQDKPAAEAF